MTEPTEDRPTVRKLTDIEKGIVPCPVCGMLNGDHDASHFGCAVAAMARAEEAMRDRLRAVVGADMPRPLVDELTRLADAVDILLDEHNYDGDGHEDLRRAQINARRYRHVIRTAIAAGEDDDEITPDHELSGGAGGCRQ